MKKKIFIISCVMLLLITGIIIGCVINPELETRIQVSIHDEPFKLSGKNVEELNIEVVRIDLTKGDKKITVFEDIRQMDILKITANDPVVLSNVSIEAGTYDQLRLVLSNNSTIKVDGEIFPIKIPSGQQSGVKLDGPFTIPEGKLFKLVIDFVASESVIYNKGQGYSLKPVIKVSSIETVKSLLVKMHSGKSA